MDQKWFFKRSLFIVCISLLVAMWFLSSCTPSNETNSLTTKTAWLKASPSTTTPTPLPTVEPSPHLTKLPTNVFAAEYNNDICLTINPEILARPGDNTLTDEMTQLQLYANDIELHFHGLTEEAILVIKEIEGQKTYLPGIGIYCWYADLAPDTYWMNLKATQTDGNIIDVYRWYFTIDNEGN